MILFNHNNQINHTQITVQTKEKRQPSGAVALFVVITAI
jgi:hypothetical protein